MLPRWQVFYYREVNKVSVAIDIGKRRTTISISQGTKETLSAMKHPGQSYDGVIQDLLEFWKQKKREYRVRSKEQQKVLVG